jgi:plasmid stabilization system protein ParE
MATLIIEWTRASKSQFDELRQRAIDTGNYEQFKQTHNEIVVALRDLAQAREKGELLYKTRRPGGEVRHWIHQFISVSYVVFGEEEVGWILAYRSVPESWPD